MKPLTVGIDARLWPHPGIGRYLRELSFRLAAAKERPALCFFGDGRMREELGSRAGERVDFRCAGSGIYIAAEQMEIAWLARGSDLLHVPHFNIPVLCPKKMAVTVHDLIYVRDARASRSRFGPAYARWLFSQIARKADAVLAVSEHTRSDLLNTFPGVSAERVFVTHEAASERFRKIGDARVLEEARRRHALERPFVLFVGTLKPHKNVPSLIRAMARLRDQKKTAHELVLVGRRDLRDKEVFEAMKGAAGVRYLGELPDEELVLLYNLADLFVLPSFQEGFGLPVLEAMACGTPVAASNVSSIPEITRGAARLFDPRSVDALEEVLYTILKDKDLRDRMSVSGLERAATFSWEETARRTLQVYRKVLS